MTTAILVTPIANTIPVVKDALYVGVDAGCLKIIDQNLPLAYAVGDFDSMDIKQLEKIPCPYDILPVKKDETDSEWAIEWAQKQNVDSIVLFGSLSGRMDHTMANVRLLMYRYKNLILQDETQKMMRLDVGVHAIANSYTHCSFFAIEPSQISLCGFIYDVMDCTLNVQDVFAVSNSFEEEVAYVHVHSGSLLCILSNEK